MITLNESRLVCSQQGDEDCLFVSRHLYVTLMFRDLTWPSIRLFPFRGHSVQSPVQSTVTPLRLHSGGNCFTICLCRHCPGQNSRGPSAEPTSIEFESFCMIYDRYVTEAPHKWTVCMLASQCTCWISRSIVQHDSCSSQMHSTFKVGAYRLNWLPRPLQVNPT